MSGPDRGIVKPDRRHCREVRCTWMDGPVSSALERWEDRTG